MEELMGFLVWDAKFEFGIQEIDEQHKKWLSILNNFYDHLYDSNMENVLLDLVNEALNYTHFHFREEEKFLAKINYPHLQEQKQKHSEIAEMLSSFKNNIIGKKMVVSITITNELKKWFKEHILIEDMKYAEFYKKQKKQEFGK
jgi:hemerythrin